MFSDECSVEVGCGRDKQWAFMYPWEKYDHDKTEEKQKAHGLRQMVWGAIWLDSRGRPHRSELVIMPRDFESEKHDYSGNSYIKALEEGLLPYYQPGVRFQQDNARIHEARHVKRWFEDHGILVMKWPRYSPDLTQLSTVARPQKTPS